MNNITQITTRRQAIINYSKKKGVTAAARRYNVGRATIYRWMKRYDSTLDSLKDRSHRPHSHPNQHTEEEIKLKKDIHKRNKHTGLVVVWVKLRQKGYTSSIPSLWRMLNKLELQPIKPPTPKYIPKSYEKMKYPGQQVQIDVKFVPDACIVCDAKTEGREFYQYTAIDEYSRFLYLEAFEAHSSYSSAVFLEHKLLDANGLPHIKFHALRHSCISFLANNNSFSMKQIQDYAGHGNFLTTFNVYSHADDSAKKTEMDYITSCFTDLFGSSDDE